jgi:hypothetical protein
VAANADPTARSIQAGLLTWLLPGAGHWLLGHRALGIVFFVAISLPYLLGVAIGGAKNSVNPRTNGWLFLAEMGVGGYTTGFYFVSNAIDRHVAQRRARGEEFNLTEYVAYFPESDLAQIYLATAGLLNLLAILDAISRAQYGGLPTFHRDLPPEGDPGGAR